MAACEACRRPLSLLSTHRRPAHMPAPYGRGPTGFDAPSTVQGRAEGEWYPGGMGAPGVVYHPYETLDDRARTLAELSEILDEIGSEHVLIGGLAVGYHGRLRATVDVDMLVPREKLAALAAALTTRGYAVVAHPDMVRAYPPGVDPAAADAEAIADLVAQEAHPLLEAAARHGQPARVLGHPVRIVARGALVALKFHAAISPRRAMLDRQQDLVDIGRVVVKRFDPADERLAIEIAAHAYPGAEHELAALLDDLRHGRPVKL